MHTYSEAIAGGMLIGASAVLMMLFLGRITGISGIIWGAIQSWASGSSENSGQGLWRYLFILGLPLGALLASLLLNITPQSAPSSAYGMTILAGLLVGFGTRMGSGCTSGHGVCGISRFSSRSLLATLCFMGAGIATVLLLRLGGGLL